MTALPADLRELLSLEIDIWGGGPCPEILNEAAEPADVDADAGPAVLEDDARLGFLSAQVLEPAGREKIVQEVRRRRRYGAKAHGVRGCITALKRTLAALPGDAWGNLMAAAGPQAGLEPLRDGVWTNEALIAATEATNGRPVSSANAKAHDRRLRYLDSLGRQLRRLEAGKSRVDPRLVVRLAETFGVNLDQLVYTHEVHRRTSPRGKKNPIAQCEALRLKATHDYLRSYPIDFVPLGDDASYRKLAEDIMDRRTGIELRWRPGAAGASAGATPAGGGAERHLRKLLGGKGEAPSSLIPELRAVVQGIERHGLSVRVGRHIGVTPSEYPPEVAPPGDPMRCVTVVAAAPDDVGDVVDLLPSWRRGATHRKELLLKGDRSMVRHIRADIDWCGHWEGRWLPCIPLDMPEWIRRAAEPR